MARTASGTSRCSLWLAASIVSTRLWTKNTCPDRLSSRRIACRTSLGSYSPTSLTTPWPPPAGRPAPPPRAAGGGRGGGGGGGRSGAPAPPPPPPTPHPPPPPED